MGAGKQIGRRHGWQRPSGGFSVRQLLPKAGSHSEEWWLHAESICRDKELGLGQVAREIGRVAPDRDLEPELCDVLEKETEESFEVIMRLLSWLS